MPLTKDHIIDLVIQKSISRHQPAFVSYAIWQWDQTGEGSFPVYIQNYVTLCWQYLARRN